MGVGALWSPGGKNPAWLRVHEWSEDYFGLSGTMEVVEQDDMGEAFEVFQALHVLRKDCDSPFY